MKNSIILAIIFLATVFRIVAQTNYYVDGANGNDLNNGTSLATAWKTIQKACNAATPNSNVQIKAGTYNENIIVNVNGTSGNPITFRNYLNDVVLIDGTSTLGTTMLTLTNKNYLNFQNLTIQNLTVNNAQGVLIETTGANTSTTLLFKNITIKSIKWVNNSATIPTANNNAQGLIAYGRDGGITNITIDSCQIFNCILGFSEAVSLDGNVNGFKIKNCQVHDNTNIGILIAGNYNVSSNPLTDHARNGLVTNNICYKNVSLYATSAGIYVDGGKNTLVEKNTSYENGTGIEIGCEENGTTDSITVKNNLIYNNQVTGLYVGGYTTLTTGQVLNSILRNNTLFQNNSINDGTGELAISKASNCKFENNIFYTNNQNVLMSVDNISPQTNNILNYNCWYTSLADSNNIIVNWKTLTYTSFSSYRTGTAQESNSIYNNPTLVNPTLPIPDLHLLSNSPSINKGNPSTLISSGETDYEGNMRVIGGIVDIGAYEFNSALGINKTDLDKSSFFVYPNPFSSVTTVSFNTELKNARLEIYNIEGQEIKIIQNIYGKQIIIDRSNLLEGIYFLKIIEDNHNFINGKLIIRN